MFIYKKKSFELKCKGYIHTFLSHHLQLFKPFFESWQKAHTNYFVYNNASKYLYLLFHDRLTKKSVISFACVCFNCNDTEIKNYCNNLKQSVFNLSKKKKSKLQFR